MLGGIVTGLRTWGAGGLKTGPWLEVATVLDITVEGKTGTIKPDACTLAQV